MTSTAETRTDLGAAYPRAGRAGAGWPSLRARRGAAGLAACPPAALVRAVREAAAALAGADLADGAAAALPLATDAACLLWARHRRFDAADPTWPDRDRFLFSPGHGGKLRQALCQVTGHVAEAPAVLAGAAGEGFAAAVGMALAERMLAARFGRSLVDHRTWVLASGADLMLGQSHEAASLAGHLALERLVVLWDEAEPEAAGEDTLRRFAAYGWATRRVAAGDHAGLAAALAVAARSRRPVLLACRSGAVAAIERGAGRRRARPESPEVALAAWRDAGQRGATARRAWLKRLAHHPRRAEFERVIAARLPETLGEALERAKAALAASPGRMTTRSASEQVMAALAGVLPELVGAAAGAAPPPLPERGLAARLLRVGHRGLGMAAALNGVAAHGGLLPCAGSAGPMSEALRLAATARSRVVHVLHREASASGLADAAHLAGLRAVPNLQMLCPADRVETAECWELALRRSDGPSLLLLGGEAIGGLRGGGGPNRCAEGGYVLAETEGARHATLIAAGAEVALALAARLLLAAERIAVAVVSLPCWDRFAHAGAAQHAQVLGQAPRIGIEAGSSFGWERWLGPDGVFFGGDRAAEFTAPALAALVRRRLAA